MEKRFTGTVVRATGSWYDVLHDGAVVRCRIRGRLRLRGVRSTNPVVVGDEVTCEADAGGDYVICDISPRRNYVIRRASNLSKESHIIAANVDQALLMATLRSPETATEFVDRFLVTCEAYKVPVTILLSKIDLQDPQAVADFRAVYESAGYRVMEVSSATRRRRRVRYTSCSRGARPSFRAIRASENRRSSAPSTPRWTSVPGEISESHHKGRHTTTFSTMYPLAEGGAVIDTPGIKGFRADRHRRCRVVALLPRNDAHGPRLPVLQLHPHPRTGMCGGRSRRTGADRLSPLRKLPQNTR